MPIMGHRGGTHRTNVRPGGFSDSDSNSDSDELCFGGIIPKKTKRFTHSQNGVSHGPAEDWEEESNVHQVKVQEWGSTPAEAVRFACMRGDLEKLKELMSESGEYKAGVNQFFMKSEENPLIMACLHGRLQLLDYLLTEKKANPDLRHPSPKLTALMALVGSDFQDNDNDESITLQGVTALVAANASLNLQDQHGLTALMIAIKRRRNRTAKFLLEKGADPNLTAYDEDQTALIFAAMDGQGPLCRLLLEHGADIHLFTRFGFSAADVAQDKDHCELANMLYLAKGTKWKPGLHPKLMQEVDEEAVIIERNKNSTDSFAMKEEACIDLLLGAVKGEHYLKNFKKHKITYVQFLHLDGEQLKEIGVDEVGVRSAILEKIKQIQNAQWKDSSIKLVAPNENVTAAEALCMIVNINDHLLHISSSLKYLHHRISKKPLALRYDMERNKLEDLIKFCEGTEANCVGVREDAVGLHKMLGELKGWSEFKISGRIPKRTFEEYKKKGSGGFTVGGVIKGFVGAVAGVGLGLILYGNFKKGHWFWKT